MSVSEFSQIMREAGLSSSTSTSSSSNNDKIRVEHVFVLQLSENTDRIAKGLTLALLEIGRSLAESCRIVAIGAAMGFLLWGTARLIESTRTRQSKSGTKVRGENL